MESAVSFAPLRPADFVNFAGRGGARPAFRGAGQPVFPRGGAYIPALRVIKHRKSVCSTGEYFFCEYNDIFVFCARHCASGARITSRCLPREAANQVSRFYFFYPIFFAKWEFIANLHFWFEFRICQVATEV